MPPCRKLVLICSSGRSECGHVSGLIFAAFTRRGPVWRYAVRRQITKAGWFVPVSTAGFVEPDLRDQLPLQIYDFLTSRRSVDLDVAISGGAGHRNSIIFAFGRHRPDCARHSERRFLSSTWRPSSVRCRALAGADRRGSATRRSASCCDQRRFGSQRDPPRRRFAPRPSAQPALEQRRRKPNS